MKTNTLLELGQQLIENNRKLSDSVLISTQTNQKTIYEYQVQTKKNQELIEIGIEGFLLMKEKKREEMTLEEIHFHDRVANFLTSMMK